jgi:hypothetical protein
VTSLLSPSLPLSTNRPCSGQTPSDPVVNATMHSHYKHHHTVKFSVGMAPNGAVTLPSLGYGGAMADVEITHVEKVASKPSKKGRVFMVDKGDVSSAVFCKSGPFSTYVLMLSHSGYQAARAQLLVQGHSTLLPPVRAKGQDHYSAAEATQTTMVANLRIDVECIMRRIHSFRMLSGRLFALTRLDLISRMFRVAARLCNFDTPFRPYPDYETCTGATVSELLWGSDSFPRTDNEGE